MVRDDMVLGLEIVPPLLTLSIDQLACDIASLLPLSRHDLLCPVRLDLPGRCYCDLQGEIANSLLTLLPTLNEAE
jgi:hypothetical protein